MKRLREYLEVISYPIDFKRLYVMLRETLLNFVLLVTAIGFAVCIYWLIRPYTPIRIDEFVLDKQEVMQGRQVCFHFHGEKLMPLSAKCTVDMVNGEDKQVLSYTADNPCGTLGKERCFTVPYGMHPQNYTIKWTGKYHPNPLREVPVVVETQLTVLENTRLKDFVDGIALPQGRQGE